MAAMTDKVKLFCSEYIVDLHGKNAATRAGFSEHTAKVQAAQMLQREDVQAEIQRLMDKRSQRTNITADRVLRELARIAFHDPRKLMQTDSRGNVSFTPSDKLSDDDAACVAELSQSITKEGGSTKMKLHDKLSALDKLGRNLKLFTDVTENKVNFTQMGRVEVVEKSADGKINAVQSMTFNVGAEPDKPT